MIALTLIKKIKKNKLVKKIKLLEKTKLIRELKSLSKLEIILATIAMVIFIVIIGSMSYKDMNPDTNKQIRNEIRTITSEYYIDTSATKEVIPDDSKPISIFVGKIYKGKSGKYRFKHQGMKPTTFAQRQANLIFRITHIPEDYEPIIKIIGKEIDLWNKRGTDVIALYFDYRPKNPDFKTYKNFLVTLRGTPKTREYHVIPSIDMSWINNKTKSSYITLSGPSSGFFVYGKYKNFVKQLKKLNDIGYAFRIKIPANYVKNKETQQLLLDNKYFGSAMKTINSDSEIPKEKDLIRLLPKILN